MPGIAPALPSQLQGKITAGQSNPATDSQMSNATGGIILDATRCQMLCGKRSWWEIHNSEWLKVLPGGVCATRNPPRGGLGSCACWKHGGQKHSAQAPLPQTPTACSYLRVLEPFTKTDVHRHLLQVGKLRHRGCMSDQVFW